MDRVETDIIALFFFFYTHVYVIDFCSDTNYAHSPTLFLNHYNKYKIPPHVKVTMMDICICISLFISYSLVCIKFVSSFWYIISWAASQQFTLTHCHQDRGGLITKLTYFSFSHLWRICFYFIFQQHFDFFSIMLVCLSLSVMMYMYNIYMAGIFSVSPISKKDRGTLVVVVTL